MALLDSLPGQFGYFYKSPGIGGDWFTQAGSVQGSTPASGAGAIPDRTTTGALPLRNGAAGKQLYLAGMSLAVGGSNVGSNNWVMLYDRLWANSGMNWGTSAVQTIGSPTVTRDNGLGAPVMLLTNYSGANANGTATVVNASYTNQSGTAGQTATLTQVPVNLGQNAIAWFDLAAGDTGVKSVESMTIPVVNGSGGNLGIILVRPIALLNAPHQRISQLASKRDWMSTALAPVNNDSCLTFLTSFGAPTSGWLQMIEG